MPRPRAKKELLTDAKENHEKFNLLISNMTEDELNTPFDFSKMKRKKKLIGKEIRI